MSTGKGKKRLRNQPVLHNELKKQHGIFLTDTSWHFVCDQAVRQKTSASEYLEGLIKSKIEETTL
ncbi:hypothetical protein G7B40_032065 [Aetokthonos hydrillicola Thurmond2011]|jgi:hypothetical protein|uniref:Uncharacterized protein n=1 Tax=Aetokthonos hydrillicola Thurmond2011 TaxID=2712845 RepID=A0AAP5MD58_9CYAN|nr:hypothetical protein [Aetokthonos hydrillicola CCALA 1050]MBW4589667.1 hypothetical protein [Aetokthonos hydrillicola CCALA 1050]MDR9899163.1 hypothetical protein [Aetokthonos hydrillicola Thurmond2011]